jgi:hypothetical protein
MMSMSEIAASAQAAGLYVGPSNAVISQVTTTNADGATITITTSYANGTSSTVTQPAPASLVTTRQVTSTNLDGTLTITTIYADGRIATSTQTSANPPLALSPLDPARPAQHSVLLWV